MQPETFAELFKIRDLYLVFVAVVLGFAIGFEREYHNKSAGLRTQILVCVGACIYTILSLKIGTSSPDRIAANIITGIGFLGAGVIFKDENKVRGLTTACTIWIMSAIGMCAGSGHVTLAFAATATVIFVLWNLSRPERWIDALHTVAVYRISTEYRPGVAEEFRLGFRRFGLEARLLSHRRQEGTSTMQWQVSGKKKAHAAAQEDMLDRKDVSAVEF